MMPPTPELLATTGDTRDMERFGAPESVPGRRREAGLLQLQCDDFVECYRLHYPRLVRALELGGASHAQAEDLAQEAFARMLARWRRVRTGTSPAGYAYRTAFRLMQRRGPSGSSASPKPARPDPGPASGPGPSGPAPAPASAPGAEGLVTTRMAVAAGLAAMPPKRRACAVLSLVVGLSTPDVAAALGITEGTVRKHIEEARADLRGAL